MSSRHGDDAAYCTEPTPVQHRSGWGRRAPVRSTSFGGTRLVALAAAVLGAGVGSAAMLVDGAASAPASAGTAKVVVEAGPLSGVLTPGTTVTGSVLVSNATAGTWQVGDVTFAAPPTLGGCSHTGVSLAPTLPPTPEVPLEILAGGSTTLEFAAYMDGESDNACQGATLTSTVLLDGEPAGTVVLTAGRLDRPSAPTGGLTTSTRAAVRWSPSAAGNPGWVVERAVAGTDDWKPACGSSPRRPVRALSCTDAGLTRSTAYAYRVTLRTGHWHLTSPPSAPVRTQDRPST